MPSYHCRQPSCPNIIQQRGYCNEHQHLKNVQHNEAVARYDKTKRNKEAARFYGSSQWIATRLAKLAENPICQQCNIDVATEVHHDEAVRSNWERRLDMSNLLSFCGKCHKKLEAARARAKRIQVAS